MSKRQAQDNYQTILKMLECIDESDLTPKGIVYINKLKPFFYSRFKSNQILNIKLKYLIILLSAVPFWAFSQEIKSPQSIDYLMSNPRQNILYSGIKNDINFIVNKYPCSSISLKTKNAEIKQYGNSCSYTVVPKEKGTCIISIVKKHTNEIIGDYKFIVSDLPLPVIIINGKEGGDISARIVKAQLGLQAELLGFDIQSHYVVSRFTLIILRNNQPVFTHTITGHRFSSDVIKALNSIQVKDKIILANVFYKKVSGEASLKPAEFLVVE